MHFDSHQIRAQELIREADEYRLARQARRTKPSPRTMTVSTSRPTPLRLLARLRR